MHDHIHAIVLRASPDGRSFLAFLDTGGALIPLDQHPLPTILLTLADLKAGQARLETFAMGQVEQAQELLAKINEVKGAVAALKADAQDDYNVLKARLEEALAHPVVVDNPEVSGILTEALASAGDLGTTVADFNLDVNNPAPPPPADTNTGGEGEAPNV